jgi:phage/plasmid-like protein (TIGR03299 family)
MINQIKSLDDKAGTDLTGEHDLGSVLERSNLNFEVEKVPVHTPEGNEVAGKYLLRRTDNNFVLGTCGKRYHIVDNEQMFAPFDSLVKEHGATYENAGMISHGKTCWVSARLGDDFKVRDDSYQRRVIMLLHHNGLSRNSYFSFNNRVICNNMMGSLNSASRKTGMGVKHTPNWEDNLTLAIEAFKESITSSNEFVTNISKLANIKMTKMNAARFAFKFFNEFRPIKAKDRTARSKTRNHTKVEELIHLFEEGMGNEGKTRYDMFNAVTEYLDHRSARGNGGHGRRFISNLNGLQAAKKRRAVKELLVA